MSDPRHEPFVEIYRSTDPVEAEMVNEILCAEGIDARLLGTRVASLLAAAPHIFEQRIEVPGSQESAASTVVAELMREEQPDGAGPTQDDPTDTNGSQTAHLSRLVAAGVALVFPGAAHVYARRAGTAIPLMLGAGLGIMHALGGPLLRGLWMVIGAVLFDLLGGQVAVGSFNRGQRVSLPVQFVHGLIALGLIVLVALAMTR